MSRLLLRLNTNSKSSKIAITCIHQGSLAILPETALFWIIVLSFTEFNLKIKISTRLILIFKLKSVNDSMIQLQSSTVYVFAISRRDVAIPVPTARGSSRRVGPSQKVATLDVSVHFY